MDRLAFVFYVFLLFALGYWCKSEFIQERAKVKYWNPKYIKDVVVFTGRRSRREPYRTNLTSTLLVPYGNNVSAAVVLQLKSGGDFRVVTKVCESMKNKWMQEFVVHYSNLTLQSECPLTPGTYRFMNMELPPRNWPMPIMRGDYNVILELFVTATKESIMEASTSLHSV